MFRVLKIMFNSKARKMEDYEITIEELKEKQVMGASIIDVRSQQEYEEGHLEGAINIPYYEIKRRKINLDKGKEIVVYCEKGSRSRTAYRILKKFGYKNVYSLYMGMDNWV